MDEVLKIYAAALDAYKAKNFEVALEKICHVKNFAPNWAKVYLLESCVFSEQNKIVSALESLTNAFSRRGDDNFLSAEIFSRLGSAYRDICETDLAVESFLESARLEENFSKKRAELSNAIFAANDSENFSAQDFQNLYAEYRKTFSDVKPFDKKIFRHEKIRVGYLSADFRTHPAANFIWALLKFHDRKKFSVYCYNSSKWFDEITAQFKNFSDVWRDVEGIDDAATAKIIHDDEIDILFELGGHTANNRLAVLAYRPARVQISGIGYMNSTGLNCADYFLTDKFCAEDLASWKKFFVEKPLILPRSHFGYAPLKNFPEVSNAPCIRKNFVTFGSFNNFSKVTRTMLETWRKILQRVPKSRLILKHKIFDGAEGCDFVRNLLSEMNFDLRRIELREFTKNYLEEYNEIDIALDTFPYAGGATTCEALYMGVPVISLYGGRHGTRFGYSILNNVGVGELATKNLDEYISRAVALAEDFLTLSTLRKNLRRIMKKSPLMDWRGYVHDVEEKFFEICKGEC